jgi:hypothetical protein
MNRLLQASKRTLVLVTALAGVIALGSIAAVAVPTAQVLRDTNGDNHTGRCCSTWDQSVRVNEPTKPVPIVVTWSADYQTEVPFLVGLRLNGGPCTFYGSSALPAGSPADGTFASKTFEWVIMPGDFGLVSGSNVIRLCGGGVFADTDSIVIGFSTLTARVGK